MEYLEEMGGVVKRPTKYTHPHLLPSTMDAKDLNETSRAS